jgi:hypothetical protein
MTSAKTPATAASITAISDLFGLPPSTEGAAFRAFRMPTRLTTVQTAQPITALRLLITLMLGSLPPCSVLEPLVRARPERLNRLGKRDAPQLEQRRAPPALEAGEVGTDLTVA